MNRANSIRLCLRFANSLSLTRQQGFQLHRLNQVTLFSYLPQSQEAPPFGKPHFYPNFHQYLYFSSNPESFVQIILSNDWSDEIEKELEILNPKVSHEFVVYVLKKLNENPRKSLDFFKWARGRKGTDPSFMPYSLLLRSLACKEFLKEFWVIALEMKEKGLFLDKQFCANINTTFQLENLHNTAEEWAKFHKSMNEGDGKNDFVKDVVKVISGSDWSEGVESKLKKIEFPLSDHVLYSIIWNLRNEPLKAMKFCEWVVQHREHKHNSVTYSGIAMVLARRGLMTDFWDLVTRMRSEGYEIDSYARMSRVMGIEDAVRLYEFMMDGPYKLSEQESIWVLKNIAHDYDPDIRLVDRVVNKYVEAGNDLTKAMYDGIHRSLCKVGRFDEAKKIVEDMRNAGYKPDNITYSQEVFGLCKVRRFEDSTRILEEMEAEGCVPDVKTWTILIQGYCAADRIDEALSCFAQMLERKHEPDADLLEVLLNGFLSHKKLLGAYKFMVKMVDKAHLKPWQATYKLMIDKLMEDGKLEEAFKLLRMMREQGYPPYAKPIAEYISKSGTVEDAKKLLGALSMKEIAPSTAAYVNIIASFFEEGRYTEAKDLLYGSPHRVRNQKKIKSLFGSEQSS